MRFLKNLFAKMRKNRQIEQENHVSAEREEKFTACDKCEKLKECMDNGYVFDVTTLEDTRRHFDKWFGYKCEKA
ncbi:MAG: hypothetical protein IJZ23_07935 [Roseburia sp.]|nr:hypothetical protein [Roseburia sp.]